MLEINNVSKEYKNNLKAVNNVSMHINEAEVVGFLGSNGAGKTTLVKMISNIIYPSSGKITFNGENVNTNKLIAQKYIGTMFEGARNVYNFLSIEDNIQYFTLLNQLDETKVKEQYIDLLNMFNLIDKRYEIVNKLSRGMQQKVAIMVSVLKDPHILILDEPTLGLDVASQIKMRDFLKELRTFRKKTLIICTHDIALAESVCDKIAIFHKGNVLHFGNFDSLKYSSNTAKYRCIIKKSDYIMAFISNNTDISTFAESQEIVEFEISDISKFIMGIRPEDILLLEKQGNNLENMLRRLG